MKRLILALALWFFVGLGCSNGGNSNPTPRPTVRERPVQQATSTTTPVPPTIAPTATFAPPTATLAPEQPPEASTFTLFSINIQDFSYPAESAAVLDKIITLHETYGVPVDIYLTDVMAQIYAEPYPALLERLKTSPVVAVSYHARPPRPYVNQYDWVGLRNMSAEQLYETVLRYETHAVDPVSGQTTDAPGGYQYVASLMGYPPYAGSALTADPTINETVMRVFRELGAQVTVKHGKAMNLGDTKNGLTVRPEHADYKLFEQVGEDAGAAFENAVAQARNSTGGEPPYFVGVKMHDNNFFATQSAWLTVYLDGGKRPDWDTSRRASLLSQDEQDAVWALYEQTVIYVAAQAGRIVPVNLPLVLQMSAIEN